jgi:hypothetical protein
MPGGFATIEHPCGFPGNSGDRRSSHGSIFLIVKSFFLIDNTFFA